MIWGMTLSTFTLAHVVVSLVGILSGVLVMRGMLSGAGLDGWTPFFLLSTALTSISGFGFPSEQLLPSHVIGIVSLVVLAIALMARYAFHLAGVWRGTYVICATIALYLNVFVLIAQSFRRVPALEEISPTQTEAPFLLVQVLVLFFFIWMGTLAAHRLGEQRVV